MTLVIGIAVGGCGITVTEPFQTIPASPGPLKPGASPATACEETLLAYVELVSRREVSIPPSVLEHFWDSIFAECTYDEVIGFGDKVADPVMSAGWSSQWDKEFLDSRCLPGHDNEGSRMCTSVSERQ